MSGLGGLDINVELNIGVVAVTSFDVQPGAAGGSVYRLSISSDATTDPNEAVPGEPVKVPVMGPWFLMALILSLVGLAVRRSHSGR